MLTLCKNNAIINYRKNKQFENLITRLELINMGIEKNFELEQYVFTDSRVCSIAQLLWNFDNYKKFVNDTLNNKEYYEIRTDNTDVTMLLFKKDFENYVVQDKYSFLMFLYLLQNSPKVFSKGTNTIIIEKENLIKQFNIDMTKFSVKKCFIALNQLMSLRITYNYKDEKGRERRRISHLIDSIDYDVKDLSKGCRVVMSYWLKEMFSNVEYLTNKFYKGSIDYTPFIKGSDAKPECMNLPQKLVELYRTNMNKHRAQLNYENRVYFSEILNTNKILRKRVIENAVNNINTALKKSNLQVVFDCEFTPKKFEKGHFQIVPLEINN